MEYRLDAKDLADKIEKIGIDAARYQWLRQRVSGGPVPLGKELDLFCDSGLGGDTIPTLQSWIDLTPTTGRRLLNAQAVEEITAADKFFCQWKSCHDLERCSLLARCKNSTSSHSIKDTAGSLVTFLPFPMP